MLQLGRTQADRDLWGRQLEGGLNSKVPANGESQLSLGSTHPLKQFSVSELGQGTWDFNNIEQNR